MRVALIGVGMVADTHVLALRDAPGLTLSGVCGRSHASAKAYAQSLQTRFQMSCQAYADVDTVAQDPDIDFVIIATPPDARASLVSVCVEAGKPILMEKPIERTLGAARDIVSTCQGRVPLGIMFQHRAREASIALGNRLAELGALQTVEITVPWWRDQSYYDVPGRGTYARDGGGVLISQAIHTLDLALSLTGPVRAVQAFARSSTAHQMETEDFVSAGLEFANGAVGSLMASTASFPGAAERITLHCAKASAILGEGVLRLHWRDGRMEEIGAAATTGGGADPMAFTHAWHQSVIEDFAQALRTGRAPMCSGQEALKVHALIDALIQSSTGRKLVEVPNV